MKFKKYYVGLTPTEKDKLARKLKTSMAYLSQLKNGNRFPGLRIAFAIERLTKGKVSAKSWL